ncbi:MAG: phosphocholine cytidylyltransferase family protein [Sphingosinicella sp.]|uniref:phosphocholine cytidylyltransferase family protein n=1 Tax=Sphingosinicella sp. TaxID=1917971 RepID=UPI004037CA41
MICLIIAAGLGSRLRAVSDSKPLTPVCGVPLIEHVIRAAAAAGATRFHVATGHETGRVEAFLSDLESRTGLPIRAVRVADWAAANGHSVIEGADGIDGDYLLLMSDHLFDPEIVRALSRAPRPAGLRLAVDRDLARPGLDLDDATKVAFGDGGRIAKIGKLLERYDAVDTGIFHATPALAAAIREAIAGGGVGSLSEGVQRLADKGEAETMDVAGRFWLDVDDPPSLKLAEAMIGAA